MAASLVADMAGYLRAKGIDADAVCRRAGIEPRTAATSAERILGDAMASLWREAVAATGDPDLGLHTGANFQPGALDIVGYVMLSSHTAHDALRRGARLMRVLNDGLALDVERTPTKTTCRVRILDVDRNFLHDEPRQVIETLLMGTVCQLRLLTERSLVPHSVHMRHPRPSTGDTEHTCLFGVPVNFNAEQDMVTFDDRDLDIELRSGNPHLLAAFETHAASALRALDVREALAGRALREIMGRLKGETPAVPVVAKAVAMSPS